MNWKGGPTVYWMTQDGCPYTFEAEKRKNGKWTAEVRYKWNFRLFNFLGEYKTADEAKTRCEEELPKLTSD